MIMPTRATTSGENNGVPSCGQRSRVPVILLPQREQVRVVGIRRWAQFLTGAGGWPKKLPPTRGFDRSVARRSERLKPAQGVASQQAASAPDPGGHVVHHNAPAFGQALGGPGRPGFELVENP